jgi:hypothetical protein
MDIIDTTIARSQQAYSDRTGIPMNALPTGVGAIIAAILQAILSGLLGGTGGTICPKPPTGGGTTPAENFIAHAQQRTERAHFVVIRYTDARELRQQGYNPRTIRETVLDVAGGTTNPSVPTPTPVEVEMLAAA